MLQPSRLVYHMENIATDYSLSNRSSFDQKYLSNIKNLYQHAGKCDDQYHLKNIFDASIVSTTGENAFVSPSVPETPTSVKNRVLGNYCFYSPTYMMVKRKQKNVLLELQDQNAEPLKLLIACGPKQKKQKGIQK